MEKIVIKIGGSIAGKLPNSFFASLARVQKMNKYQLIIVHGGGPEINGMLQKIGIQCQFVDGLRVTTKEVLDIAEMVMSGSVNKNIVHRLQQANISAVGISGVDGALLVSEPADPSGKLGYVGKVKRVNKEWLEKLLHGGAIPVISPIGLDEKGEKYNINADMAAAAVAAAVNGKLIFISDIPGVMEKVEGKTVLHPLLNKEKIEQLIAAKVIHGGMIPKVRSALQALTDGAKETVIVNGIKPDDLWNYLQGKNAGTIITTEEVQHV